MKLSIGQEMVHPFDILGPPGVIAQPISVVLHQNALLKLLQGLTGGDSIRYGGSQLLDIVSMFDYVGLVSELCVSGLLIIQRQPVQPT